jgi:hypothetical protein
MPVPMEAMVVMVRMPVVKVMAAVPAACVGWMQHA